MKNSLTDTIAAVSTPIGGGGIGIVRMSGKRALEIADRIFASKDGILTSKRDTYTVHYGRVVDGENNFVDEALLSVMRSPKSYTKEDIVEINCHGGISAVKKALELILSLGARLAEPGEFTKRAFLNGRIDLAQAEAVCDIVNAKTESALKIATAQLEGALSGDINAIRDEVIDIAGRIEAAIDFPEEDIDIIKGERLMQRTKDALEALKALIDSSDRGMIMREGVLAVICGRPNVGKSSLMNLLLKRDRVIVTPLPGTTRDVVEETINLRGVPVRVMDSAGIGSSSDIIQKESNRKAKRSLDIADIVIFVLDGSAPLEKEDIEISALLKKKKKNTIPVINKADLPQKLLREDASSVLEADSALKVSAKDKTGIDDLEGAISDRMWAGRHLQGEGSVVANARHREALEAAYNNLNTALNSLKDSQGADIASVDIKEAIYHLGLITGKSVSDDILDRIFENFCIGK
ncbi:tRNA uridine-5-carboxymethylaminomethyl(34) synthesis GTPase MnmE [Candidatus Omnitrophota bacterium]